MGQIKWGKMAKKQKTEHKRKSLSHYYNASQYRIDTWNRLKSVARQLANGSPNVKEQR